MKNTLTCLLILLSFITYSQNAEVDKRNGFKDIKLGSPYSSFEGIKKIDVDAPKQIVGVWKTSDENLGYFFDDKIDYYVLRFDSKSRKLIGIQVFIMIQKPFNDPSVKEKFLKTFKKLHLSLGDYDTNNKDNLGVLWNGNKAIMGFKLNAENIDIDEDGNAIGLSSLEFTVISRTKGEEYLEEGF